MIELLNTLLTSLEKVSQQKNEDVAFTTIYCMFLSFALTLCVVVVIAL